MGRRRNGQFVEENNSAFHVLGEQLEFGETMRREEEAAAASKRAYEHATTAPLKQPILPVRRGERRAGVTVTIALSAIDALERLSIARGDRRGYVLDDLIMTAARAELGKAK